MPWVSSSCPGAPAVSASVLGGGTSVHWTPAAGTSKIAVQAKTGGTWRTVKIIPSGSENTTIPRADAIAVTALDRFGNASPPKVLGLQ